MFSGVIVFTSVATIGNASRLHQAINNRTQSYVADVTLQLSNDIDFRLANVINELKQVESDFIQFYKGNDTENIQAFLKKYAANLAFNEIVFISKDGEIYQTSETLEDHMNLIGVQKSLQGENGVSFLNSQSILYSIPVLDNGNVVGALAGVRDKENMQKLIQSKSFSGKSLSCIVNLDGSVIIAPTDIEPYMQLDSIFSEKTDSKVLTSIEQMKEDMVNSESGVFTFTAANGTELVLSYNPLTSFNWVLLTLVSADVISHDVNLYITQTFIITAGTILLFVLILFLFVKAYRSYYRKLEDVAFVDGVTGGMNNTAFQHKCRETLKKALPYDYSIVLLNIKNFKLINESYGSEEGDRTLRYIMQKLEDSISKEELVARADADNFFLLLRENEPERILKRIEDIVSDINTFNNEIEEPDRMIIQPGIYRVDDPSQDITLMQDRAKTACRNRQAHEDGRCIFYDSAFTLQLKKEHDLNRIFESSLKNGDFKVFLQPKIRLKDGEIGGAEALVRWFHPERGTIFPSEFIPLFEKNGKICELDLFIFEETCKILSRWIECGEELFPISVNLSRRHFEREDALSVFEEIARKYRIPEGMIEMELTESIFFSDREIEQMKYQIKEMHRMGFLCSLDDFGSGYSFLGLLMEFDIDIIKLDRRFFTNVSRSKTKDVVESIIKLSRKIGAKTVAEGIETPEQLELLNSVGCDMVQGYIFSKPLPADEFEVWKQERKGMEKAE